MKINVKSTQVLEDGSYPATLVNIEEKETTYGERLMWSFEIDYEGQTLGKEGWTSKSDSEMGNLVKWAKAILGDVGSDFDTDDLLGKPCTVVIETYEDKDSNERDKVKNVKAPKRDQKGKKAATAPVEDDEDFSSIPF